MGRAGRPKNEMPPGLQELEEHGVPGGWHRYWHGDQDTVASLDGYNRAIVTRFGFPSSEILEKISKQRLTASERLQLLSELQLNGEDFKNSQDLFRALREDPLLEALYQNELLDMPPLMKSLIDEKGLKEEDLRTAWEECVLGNIVRTVKEDGLNYWVKASASAADRNRRMLQHRPTSLLGAIVAYDQCDHQELYEFLTKTKKEMLQNVSLRKEYRDFVRKEVFPIAHHILSGSNHGPLPSKGYSYDLDMLLAQDWSKAIHEAFPNKTNWQFFSHHDWFKEKLGPEFNRINRFEAAPVHNSRPGAPEDEVPNLAREFWSEALDTVGAYALEVGDDGKLTDDALRGSRESARRLLARQVLRVMTGIEDTDQYSVEDMLRQGEQFDRDLAAWSRGETASCPLENLEPIIGKEATGDLIKKLSGREIREKDGDIIRNNIFSILSLPSGWGGRKAWEVEIPGIISSSV